jgi:hypothetical protein
MDGWSSTSAAENEMKEMPQEPQQEERIPFPAGQDILACVALISETASSVDDSG